MAAKTTQTTQTAPAAEGKAKRPALAFANLSIEDAPALPKGSRTTKANPLADAMRSSHESGVTKSVTVPTVNVVDVENLVRRAANSLNVGARIRKQDNGNDTTTVFFAAAARQSRPRKANK